MKVSEVPPCLEYYHGSLGDGNAIFMAVTRIAHAMAQVVQLQPFDQFDSLFTPSSRGSPLKGYTAMMLPVGIILIPPLVHVQTYFS